SKRNGSALPPRYQRHPNLRFEGLEYTDTDIADFEERLEKIYGREIHRVQGQSLLDELGGGYLRFKARRLIACNIVGRSQTPKKGAMTDLFYLRWMDVVPAPIHALQPPPTAGPARTLPHSVAILEEEVHGIQGELGEQIEIPYVRRTRRRTDNAGTSAPQ
nr:hypothetical protein [Tanacetum cinerariifolium]GEZ46350.1 hypothetical protein [Tanacetum cinerariifolium]